MFTDSLQQLISQINVLLFHTYFPSLKPAVAGKLTMCLSRLVSHNIPLKTQEHILVAPYHQRFKTTSTANHIQHPQLHYKFFQVNYGQIEAYAVTSRND